MLIYLCMYVCKNGKVVRGLSLGAARDRDGIDLLHPLALLLRLSPRPKKKEEEGKTL